MFNRSEFWESHEVLEAPWRQHRSGFYKGLILLASAYVHVQRGNPRGIAAQMRKAGEALVPYQPAYLGFDVTALVRIARAARARVESQSANVPADWGSLLRAPLLRPERALLRGTEPELRQHADEQP